MVIIALTPFTFKCVHCKVRIFIRGMLWHILGLYAVMGVGAIVWLQWIFRTHQADRHVLFIGPALLIIAMEVIRVLLVCNRAKLEVKNKP